MDITTSFFYYFYDLMNIRDLFFKYQAQTSGNPLAIIIARASGHYIYDQNEKAYLDLISGISVSNLGHNHPLIKEAIKNQLDEHSYLMVYGELIQTPQVRLCQKLVELSNDDFNHVYLLTTGTEAVEAAMKLSKRYTGRNRIVSCKNAYHGSTQGALSLMSDEYFTQAYRPLIPEIEHISFNNLSDLQIITEDTACVICEVVQAEAGVQLPEMIWLSQLKTRCEQVGALLVFDEIQSGIGRSGEWFAYQKENIKPDVLLLGKALGASLPLSALMSSKKILSSFSNNPVLGHISTFAGHPLACAAALKGIEILEQMNFKLMVSGLAQIFINTFKEIPQVTFRQYGLLMSLEFENENKCKLIIEECIQNGILTDWFLFAPNCMRLAPPLTLTISEANEAAQKIKDIITNTK